MGHIDPIDPRGGGGGINIQMLFLEIKIKAIILSLDVPSALIFAKKKLKSCRLYVFDAVVLFFLLYLNIQRGSIHSPLEYCIQ